MLDIGLGDAHPAMRDSSLIGVTVELPDGHATKDAFFGPCA